jgi:antitoxin component YwqK of YwqJK toxin-antitoxin module
MTMRTTQFFIALLLFVFQNLAQNIKYDNKTDDKGLKQGLWEKKDDKGFKVFQGEFKDNKPIGIMKQYYKGNDSIKAILQYRKDGNVFAQLFNEANGKKNAEGKYVKEKKDSLWKFYDDLGILISSETYKNGSKQGLSKVYFPNGKVSDETTYANDKKQGIIKKFYESGQLKSEQSYKLGILEGLSVIYYPDKTEAARGYYKNGVKNHIWVYKKQDGNLESKEYWWEGIEVKEADYLKLKASTKDNKEVVEAPKKEVQNKTIKKGKKP